MKLNRRVFLGTATAASLSAPMVMGGGHGKPRVVVVGGGAGGATAARYIAKDSKGDGSVPYDKLILSPGIDFVDGAVEGWDVSAQNAMPHAYKAGSQTELLKAQIMAMPAGGTFAMVAPPNPYRCPPGPYERVSMVAHLLKANNPTAKIIVADPKEKFSKMALFQEGWADNYDGMIDWIGSDFGGGNVSVDPGAMTVTIDGEVTNVDACNVIPAMKAGKIAETTV